MRLFIGIPASPEIKECLENHLSGFDLCEIGKVKAVENVNLHLTLKFIGEYPDDPSSISDRLQDIAQDQEPFKLVIDRLGFFPSPARPKVFWAGFSDGSACFTSLAVRIDAALAGLKVPRETRKNVPHLTIMRINLVKDREKLLRLKGGLEDLLRGQSILVKDMTLFQSILSSRGPVYNELSQLKLKCHNL